MHKCPRTPRTAIATAAALAPSTWVASLAPTARVPTAARASGFLRPSAQRLATGLPTTIATSLRRVDGRRRAPVPIVRCVCVCVHNLLIVTNQPGHAHGLGGGTPRLTSLVEPSFSCLKVGSRCALLS